MENVITHITNYLWAQSWQIALLAVAIAAVSLAVKNKSAHVRYLLWLIVLAKCLVPPLLTITLAVLPQKEVAEPVVTTPVEMPVVEVEAVEMMQGEPVTLPAVPVVTQPLAKPSIVERLAEISVRQWLVFAWVVGVIVFVLAALIKALRVNRWLRRERKALPEELRVAVGSLFGDLGIRTGLKVWLVEGIGQPFVWGLMRGSVYLPGNFAKLDSDESRRGVLGHELSHILRFDAAVNLLQIIAQAIFWFHPFVWWANKRIRAEREKCCDEMAIAQLGAKAKDYSRAIVNTLIAEHQVAWPIPSLAVAGPVKNIEDRIKTIMKSGKKFYKRPSLIAAITVLLLASLAVPTTLVLTQRSEKQATSKRLKKEQEKENRDYKVLSPKLDALLGAWRATQPEPNDIGSSEYNVNLVIDLRDRKLYLERNWQEDSGTVVTMPEGYVWEIAHINPNDYKQLGDIVRLRLRGHNRQKNICPEAIAIQGRLGEEAGINIQIEPGNGYRAHWGTGQGDWKAYSSYVSRRKKKQKPRGRYTINRSLLLSEAEAHTERVKEGVGEEIGEFIDANLYQKQGSIRYALEFIGMPEELIDTTFVSKHGQLANPRQLEFANKLFSIRKSKDVDAFISLLSDGTKKQLNDDNNKRMVHHHIRKIEDGTFLYVEYDFKFFATFREFTEKDSDTLKKHVSFAETPSHVIHYWHFHKPNYMLIGGTYYLIEDEGSYKIVPETLLHGEITAAPGKQRTSGPKEYGIVAFKQTDEAYTQPGIWKYHWNIELSPDVSENNTFQILKTTKVISGQDDLHPEIAAQKIIDESMIEKYKYGPLKCRFYVGASEPLLNHHKYGRKLSGWLCGLSIANMSKTTQMLFPGKDVTNVKPNKQGNFIGSDLELLSFETSEGNIRYEHKVILRKSDSPEAKSAALLRLEQMTRRQISNKKLQYLNRILATYANAHNSKYPDRLEQIKPYDTDEWLDWLLENIEYLGKGKTLTETSNTVLAYDKTLLGKAGSTNVLFNDGPVQYCNPDWLKKLGIAGEPAGHEISVIGRVLDRPGGKGVAAVKVKLWSDWTRQSWFALTNEKGNYRFDDIEPGPYILRVVDLPAGVWTEGVAVLVTPDPQRRQPQKTKLIRSGRKGYRIAEVGTGPGQYRVSERRAGDTFEAIVITSDKQQQQRVDLYQQLPQGISGTVRDKDTGQPVAGATVDFSTIDRLRRSVRTDSKGRYRLYVPPRTISLHCEGTAEQFCPVEMGDRHIKVGQGEYTENIDFLVRSAPSFTGQVVFGDGSKAPEGVEVRAFLHWRDKRPGEGTIIGCMMAWTEVQYMKTDESGAFMGYFRGPDHLQDSESYEVLVTACARMPDASKGGAWSATTEAANPKVGEMKIVLEKMGSAEFGVVGPDGQGVTGLEVICEHWVKVNDGLRATVTEIGGGRYRAGRLIPGLEYRCWVQAKDYRQEYIRTIKPIVVRPGQHVQAPDIELEWWGKKVGIPYNLGRTGSDSTEAVPTLLEVLKKSTDKTAICRTAEALGKIGVASKPVLKALLDLLENKRGSAANAAAEALGRLGAVEAIGPIEAALNAGTIKHQIGTTALWRIKKAANAKPVAAVGSDEPAWDEAVEGIQCRLRPDSSKWQVGEPPTFMLDIRNRGTRQVRVVRDEGACKVWYDGQPYRWTPEVVYEGQWHRWRHVLGVKSSPLGPGREYTDIPISLNYRWATKTKYKPIPLREGRHTVRVAFTAEPNDPTKGEAVRVLSNPVEIEIVPLKKKVAWGKVVNNLQLGLAFDGEKRTCASGEELTLQIYVCNTGDSEVPLSWVDLGLKRPSVVDSNGWSVPYLEVIDGTAAHSGGGFYLIPNSTVLLQPGDIRMLGKTYYRDMLYRDMLYRDMLYRDMFSRDMLYPGKYRISQSCAFSIGWRPKEGYWSDLLTTGKLEFVVEAGAKPAWGEAVDGLQLGLAFDGEERPYRKGELVGFRVYVRNVGDKEIPLAYDDLAHSSPGLQGTAEKPMILTVHFTGGSSKVREHRISLRPDETSMKMLGRVELQIEPTLGERKAEYSGKLEPGQYPVMQTVKFGSYKEEDSWRGELTSGELKLVVEDPRFVPVLIGSGKDVQKTTRVAELMKRAKSYAKQGRYEEALVQIEMLLSLEPGNDEAMRMKQTLKEMISRRVKQGKVRVDVHTQLDEIVDLSGWRPEVSFGDAIKELKNSVEPPLNVVVLWGDLAENADIDQDTKINIDPLPPVRLSYVRLSYGLELLLKSVSGGKVELGYIVEDGVITIATVDSLLNRLETRVYDIALLVGPPLPGGYGTTSSGIYKPSAEAIEKVDKQAKEVAKLIKEFIEPNSWSGAGGEGVIKLYENRQLIVRQTREVHQKIEKLLQNMRRPGLGDAGIPHAGEAAYPVPWWQAARKSKPNSAVQIESRFILVEPDANEIGELLQEVEDSKIAPVVAEPNVKYYLLKDEQAVQLVKKKLAGADANCCKTLAAPKVTVFDGQAASIHISQEVAASGSEPNRPFRKPQPFIGDVFRGGVGLYVTPNISEDKKHILLNLNVQMNNFLGMETYILKTPLPDGTVDEYKQELPQIETVSVQTCVSVPDGATLLLAGQKVKSKGEQDGQVVEKDLLIFVKAEIVGVSWIDSNACPSGGGYPVAPPVKSKEPNRPGGNLSPPRAFGGFGG